MDKETILGGIIVVLTFATMFLYIWLWYNVILPLP